MKKEVIAYITVAFYVLGYALIGARGQDTDNWYYFEYVWQKTCDLLLWAVAWKYFCKSNLLCWMISVIMIVQGYRILYEVAEWVDYKHWYSPDIKSWLSTILFVSCGGLTFIYISLHKKFEKYLK